MLREPMPVGGMPADGVSGMLALMRDRLVVVPNAVRQKAAARGVEGTRWLRGLGGVIEQLEHDWDVVVGSVLHGGSESYVAAGTTGEGVDVIVKIAIPGNDLAGEATTLRLAEGHGYARLLQHDAARQAMLQERLGASLAELGLPSNLQIEIICATLRRAWQIPPPAGASLPSGADKARWLAQFIAATWEELNRPCSEPIIEQALSFAEVRRRAFDPDTAVLVHGDAHSHNTLQDLQHRSAAGARFKFIDPDGLFAERAYDLAIPMREWSSELLEGDPARLGRERSGLLGHLTGVDTQAIWEWGFVERVSTGLLVMQVGAEDVGRQMLEVAHHWVQP
jgi:streptomycin 6-kinase